MLRRHLSRLQRTLIRPRAPSPLMSLILKSRLRDLSLPSEDSLSYIGITDHFIKQSTKTVRQWLLEQMNSKLSKGLMLHCFAHIQKSSPEACFHLEMTNGHLRLMHIRVDVHRSRMIELILL